MGTEQVRHTSFIVTFFRGGGNGSDIHLLPSPFLGHGRGNWKLNGSDILLLPPPFLGIG